MKKAIELYLQLCLEFGTESMNIYTNGWKHRAIYDYMKDGTINNFILSLY